MKKENQSLRISEFPPIKMNSSIAKNPKDYFVKRKAAKILFVAAVLLIAADLAVEKIYLRNYVQKHELSGKETEEKFRTALFNFGLENRWISKKENDDQAGHFVYRVELPADLPVTLVLRELNYIFKNDFVKLESEEKRINGTTSLRIFSGNKLKLASDFRYNPSIVREAGEIAFMLAYITSLNEKEDSLLLSSPEKFDLVLIPSEESAGEAVKISKAGRGYSVLLNDEIPELKYNFRENYTETRLKASVREILAGFPDMKYILIDEASSLYTSSIYPFIEKEFLKRDKKIFKKSSVYLLNETEDVAAAFNRIAGGKNKKTILTNAQNFFLLQPVIAKYKKVGCRFVEPSLQHEEE